MGAATGSYVWYIKHHQLCTANGKCHWNQQNRKFVFVQGQFVKVERKLELNIYI